MVNTLNKTDLINEKISVCLSSSGVSGQQLRSAHYFLGAELAKQIKKKEKLINKKIAVVIMMRAGLPFGLGISDALEDSNSLDILFSPVAEKDFAGYDLKLVLISLYRKHVFRNKILCIKNLNYYALKY